MNDDWIIVVAALMILDRSNALSRKKSRKYVHSRYRKSFFNSLDSPERRVRQRKIPRCCLQNPSASAWRKLYEAGNDQAMITLTGFDCASFASLLLLFAPVFNSYTPFVPFRLPTMAIYMTNCSMSTKGMAQSALWTLHSVMLHANI